MLNKSKVRWIYAGHIASYYCDRIYSTSYWEPMDSYQLYLFRSNAKELIRRTI